MRRQDMVFAAAAQAQVALERLRQEIIPAENSPTPYGVRFSMDGFGVLTGWNTTVTLGETQRYRAFAGLRVHLPCCDFRYALPEEEKNCQCSHHLAMYGLAKKLLRDGWARAQVQFELDDWARYFYPREALASELVRRAAYDPEMARALQGLQAKGAC